MSENRDYLSQEEIDALLRQTVEDEDEPMVAEMDHMPLDDYLTPIEQDTLGEIGNITFGSAATALSTLLGQKVDITTPQVSIIYKSDLDQEFPKPHVAISVNYVEGFQGVNMLVIQTRDAQVIADLMLGGDGTNVGGEMNEIHLSAVQEAMNQMMGSSATSMSTIFNRFVNISPPGIDIFDPATQQNDSGLFSEDVFIKISFRLLIGTLIDSSIMQLLPIQFGRDMVSSLMGGAEVEQSAAAVEEVVSAPQSIPDIPMEPTPQPMVAASATETSAFASVPPMAPPSAPAYPPMQDSYMPPAAMHPQYSQMPPGGQLPPTQPMYGQPSPYDTNSALHRNVNVQSAQFSNFQQPNVYGDNANLNLLLDIPLKVTVELGRTQKVIKDILELSQGSIVELDKLAGEPVDILVNNKLIAKGEVVVIDENFGVRVTDIVSQWDRLQKIQ